MCKEAKECNRKIEARMINPIDAEGYFTIVMCDNATMFEKVVETSECHTLCKNVLSFNQEEKYNSPLSMLNIVSWGLQFSFLCFHMITLKCVN